MHKPNLCYSGELLYVWHTGPSVNTKHVLFQIYTVDAHHSLLLKTARDMALMNPPRRSP